MNARIINDDELYHYGVLGMRWGVRRAGRQLSRATDTITKDKAIETLNKHKVKGNAKVAALEKRRVKLDDKLRKATKKDKTKAAKIEIKATKLDRKAAKEKNRTLRWYVSDDKATKLMTKSNVHKMKADKLHTKANVLNANFEKAKAKVDSNEAMQQAFKTELRNIDKMLVENGRRYING